MSALLFHTVEISLISIVSDIPFIHHLKILLFQADFPEWNRVVMVSQIHTVTYLEGTIR